ncbi:MAG: KamA family radical SAM protein [Desulfuromonadaceae bacterium]|nr:KamA family radical SAM protein [Desulfuromonadaceae bacterium]
MELWQVELRQACSDVQVLAQRFALDAADLEPVAERYPVRLTPHLMKLAESAPQLVRQQFVPDPAELADGLQPSDPLNEEALSPVPQLVHRYPHRVLLLVCSSCFSYCRFCTRKRRVGCRDQAVSLGEVMRAIDHIAEHPEMNEVILSGGDPLTLPDSLLKEILERLRRIPHVDVLRLGSRAPMAMPSRITPQLCALLGRCQPLYLLTHFNHPAELTPEAVAACEQLVAAGILLINQTVLLRGVNDDPQVLYDLFYRLYRLRVRPYYLHQMDLTRGTAHFRTRLETGIAIMAGLRGRLSGLAMPHYIVDLPGGLGKIPLTPDYTECLGDEARLRAADGTLVHYPQQPDAR